jgi:hypothetical protein
MTKLFTQVDGVMREMNDTEYAAWVKNANDLERVQAEVRAQRDSLLTASDWTQVIDAPVNQAAWATYRQALRDISAQEGFPWSVVWPTEPTGV